MVRTSAGIEIDAPREEVFALLTDVGREPEWRDELVGVSLVDGEAGRPGSVYLQLLEYEGRRVEAVVTLSQVVPGERLVHESSQGKVGVRIEYRLSDSPSGKTRVDVAGEVSLGGALRLVEGMVAGPAQKHATRDLENLKALLEACGPRMR